MQTSQVIIKGQKRFCKKCFLVIKNEEYFICSCFLYKKQLGSLTIDPVIFSKLYGKTYYNALDKIYTETFSVSEIEQLYSILTILCAFFRDKLTLNHNIISKYSHVRDDTHLLFATGYNKNSTNFRCTNQCKILNLYQCYFSVLSDYEFSNKLNLTLLKKIQNLNEENHSSKRPCKNCTKSEENFQKIKDEYNNIFKNFSNAQSEKEKIVMKYVKTEKRVLEAQKSVDSANKQRDDAFRENSNLQKKLKKALDDIIKSTNENKQKQSEITQLKNHIEQLKEIDNIKEIKFKGMQNRLKYISDSQEETQKKLVESSKIITDLKNECQSLQSHIHNVQKTITGVEEVKTPFYDQNLEKQQLKVFSEPNLIEKLKISEERRSISEKENNLLLSQIQILQNECSDLKTKLNEINLLYEKEKEEGQSLKSQLYQMENTNQVLESKTEQLCKTEKELQLLEKEKSELLTDIESYRQKEIQMLGFTEQVTDKHVQLQSKFTDMKTKFLILENNQDPLLKSINKLSNRVKTLEHNLHTEKSKHNQECETLTKFLAEQIYYSQKLALQLEETEGENSILRKKKELIIRESTRES